MLDEICRGWTAFGGTASFSVGQLNVRLDPDVVRELFAELLERATELEDQNEEPIIVTMIVHPKTAAPERPTPATRGQERRLELGRRGRGARRAPGARAPCPRRATSSRYSSRVSNERSTLSTASM